MKRTVPTIILILISAILCFGQGSQKITPIKDVIQQRDYQTFCIRAEFAGVYDSSKLIFFVNEDDYIIPIRLQKRDLGAEKRFLALDLQEGDVIVVKGKLNEIDIDDETYKGLVNAVIVDEEDVSEKDVEDEEEEVPFAELEKKPSFRGGDANEFSKWVNSQLIYPKTAKKNGVQGRVTLQFTIETNGRVTNVEVIRGVDESLDKEAVRVVSNSPRWKPGYLDGKPVRVTYTFPVIFQLR
jgi:TonB family protein